MSSYFTNLKKKLEEPEDSGSESNAHDESQLKLEIEKLRGLWRNVKEVNKCFIIYILSNDL